MGAPPIESMSVDAARAMYTVVARVGDVFSTEDRTIAAPDGRVIPVRVYRASAQPDCPVVVYFHGGGWTLGSVDVYDPLMRELAARSGCVVVAVDYRLAPENPYPAALDDAYAAVVWTAANGASIGARADRVAVAGDSAGGNLAASVALRARDSGEVRLAMQALVYPVVDRGTERASSREFERGYLLENSAIDWFWGHYLSGAEARDDPYVMPARAPDLRGLPRAVVITAECDPLRDDAEAYVDRLTEAGVPVASHRYAGTFHGFFHMTGLLDQAALAMDELAEALRTSLGAP